ncbi:hypothetical protein RB195_023429 [Necator americanus]|uniref:DUF5641 domain-containing protein n=1 Tax=Necator americanus TaxID=51031 RepID=A0ABR1EJ50_NECAM
MDAAPPDSSAVIAIPLASEYAIKCDAPFTDEFVGADLNGQREVVSGGVPRDTQLQAVKALQSSYSLSERFWEIWKSQYSTALQKQHQRNIDNKRGSAKEVREGAVVLLSDSYQKRNHWKLARISKIISSNDGAVREVEVYCNRKILRHPLNQLILLELEGNDNGTQQTNTAEDQQATPPPATSRYDLRPRTTTALFTKGQRQGQNSLRCFTTSRSITWPTSIYLKMALSLTVMVIVSEEQPGMPITQSMCQTCPYVSVC